MPRPEMDPQLLADLESRYEQSDKHLGLFANPELKVIYKEVFMSGDWLYAHLEEAGCPKDQIEKICFAHGQRCFADDPWVSAQNQLQKYKAGTPDKPGMALAEEITAKFLGAAAEEQLDTKQKVRDLWYEKLSKFLE